MHSDPFRTNGVEYATYLFLFLVALATAGLTGCSSDPSPTAPGTPDTGTPTIDAALTSDASDAGSTSDASEGGMSGNVQVQIVAFNDFHGNLEPPTGSSGVVTVPIDDPLIRTLGADAGVTTNADAGT